MSRNSKTYYLVLSCVFYCMSAICQPPAIPPTDIEVSIVESMGLGCHDTTNHQNGIICFDVSIKVDTDNWWLQSYNIWMDFGTDSLVLSYNSDSSCAHADGGDLNFNKFGKYRFFAGSFGLDLPINQDVNFHNFCLDVAMFSGLENAYIVPGGIQFGTLVSSVNLVDENDNSNAINPQIEYGDTFFLSESSFLTIDPMADAMCNGDDLNLSAMPIDATGSSIMDCEPFQFLWTGPNGFQTVQPNFTLPITDPASQSGLYEFFVTGQAGCHGYQSFVVDLTSCVTLNCEDVVTIQGPLNLVNSREAKFEIIAQGDIVVDNNLTLDAPIISLMPSFEVPLGYDFETLLLGCQ